jgi:hypothetical protein
MEILKNLRERRKRNQTRDKRKEKRDEIEEEIQNTTMLKGTRKATY